MSHELRTPLNAVLGFAQLLRMDPQQPLLDDQLRKVRLIERAGAHLLAMISDVLDLSRIEAGALPMSVESLHLETVLHDAVSMVADAAEQARVSLDIAPQDAELTVRADRVRLRQVLVNLLSNAIKYNRPNGRVTVSVTRDAEGTPAPRLRIAVSDTGLGLSPSQQAQLFQPFNRLGRERSQTEGTGIGLVISQRLAELMGGSLTVRSEAGQGSTFVLTLPQATNAAPKVAEPESPYALAQAVYHRRRVVYIEDNEANASVMAGVFTQRPQIDFEVCRNAAEGLAAIDRSPPDLILLDMHLPDFSGMDVLMRLKSDAQTAGVPVVMVSADVLADQIQEALALGAAQYLTKPIDVAEVLAVVDQLLEQVETVS